LLVDLAARPDAPARPPAILVPGDTCWRLETAGRAALLVDAAPYFGALRAALLKAERSIVVVGWDIDSRFRLVGEEGEPRDGLPAAFAPFLSALVARRPELRIKLLLWDYSVLYSLDRELLPVLSLQWNTPAQIELCLDDGLPVGAAHHQKIVVIDDKLAFCGGIDLTIRRWDTAAHRPSDEGRRDPSGKPYRPFHDMQLMVDGRAAMALGDLARRRWDRAACERLHPVPSSGDPWPEAIRADFRDVSVAISRTEPEEDDRPGVREIERLFETMIGAAERWLYVENQFLTCTKLAPLLARRMRERPKLEVLIVGPKTHESWIEQHTMRNGRIRFMRTLQNAGVGARVRLLYPEVRHGGEVADVLVHAKASIVDDRLLRVGSANLNNRSMGTDTECDLAIEAREPAHRAAVLGVLARLVGEHCGAAPERVREALAETGSLFATVDRLASPDRRLVPIDDGEPDPRELTSPVEAVADPERPIGPQQFLADFAGPTVRGRHLGSIVRAAVALVFVVALVLAWRYTPLAAATRPDELRAFMESLGEQAWTPLLVVALYVLAGLVAFPVTLLIAGTAATFGAWPGAAYAAAGALASATVTYLIGRLIGPDVVRNLLGPRINRISRGVARRGVLAVTAVRLVPIAPFSLVNLVAGASRVRLFDYLMGTALGLAPGLVLMSSLGDQVFQALAHPTWGELGLLVGLAALWFAVSIGLQILVNRRRGAA
jgi:phospholipase D1/2